MEAPFFKPPAPATQARWQSSTEMGDALSGQLIPRTEKAQVLDRSEVVLVNPDVSRDSREDQQKGKSCALGSDRGLIHMAEGKNSRCSDSPFVPNTEGLVNPIVEGLKSSIVSSFVRLDLLRGPLDPGLFREAEA